MRKIKYYKKLSVICTFYIIVFGSCQNEKDKKQEVNSQETPYLIDLEANFDHYKKIDLSEIADSIEYVALETSSKCLLKSARMIKLCSDYLFVSDFEGLYKFNRNGKFICKIGHKGNGPGEYKNIRTFTIDENRKLIFIVYHWKKRIGIFNFNGDFIKTIACNIQVENIAIYDSTTIACSLPCGGFENNESNLYLIDYNLNKERKQFKDYYHIKGMHSFNFSTLKNNRGQLYFNDTFCDTVFTITNNMNQKPLAVFHFGKFKVRDTKKRMAKVSFVQRIVDTEKNIFFNYCSPIKDNYPRAGYFNKNSKQLWNVTPVKEINKGYLGFCNNFDGIVHFWPHFVGENGEFLSYYDIFKLKEMLKNTENKDCIVIERYKKRLKSIIENSKMTNNGVILIVHPK